MSAIVKIPNGYYWAQGRKHLFDGWEVVQVHDGRFVYQCGSDVTYEIEDFTFGPQIHALFSLGDK